MCFMIPIILLMVSWPVADGCAYGPGCRFPCRCEHGGCDPITGECDSRRCEQVRPTGYEFGWKSIGCRLGNIAYGKTATHRGQHKNNVAEWAVDGDTNPGLSHNSCAHPALKDGQPALWMVDLGKKYIIEEIVIFNRYNYYKERTNDFYIRIGMTSTIHEQELCIYYNGGAKHILRLTCKGPVREGRYVSMEKRQGSWDFEEMTICEFVVLGYEPIICSPRCVGTCDTLTGCETCQPGYHMPDCIDECKPYFWGMNCLKHCGKCAYNQPCDKVNGVCEHGCMQWYLNSKCDRHIAIIVSGVVGLIGSSALILGLALTFKRRSSSQTTNQEDIHVYVNEESNIQNPSHVPIPLKLATVAVCEPSTYDEIADQQSTGVYEKMPETSAYETVYQPLN